MLAKIFAVSNGTIHNWVTAAATALPDSKIPEDIKEIEFDEMWHYIGKKNESCGLSKRLTAEQIEWLRGYWESVTRRLSNGSMTK